MAETPHVLLVCSFSKAFHGFREAFKAHGMECIPSFTVREAELCIRENRLALVICSSKLLDGSFRDVLRTLRELDSRVPLIVICRGEKREEYEEAKRLGVVECLQRPLSLTDIESLIKTALRIITSNGFTKAQA